MASPRLPPFLSPKKLYLLAVSAPKEEGCDSRPSFPGELSRLINIQYKLYLASVTTTLVYDSSSFVLSQYQQSALDQFYLPNIIIPRMHKTTTRGGSSDRTTHTINSTFDSILSKGAEKLYEKYIKAKITGHMSSDFYKTINKIFGPMEDTQPGKKNIKSVHQSVIEKIHVTQKEKSSQCKQQKMKLSGQTTQKRFNKSNTIQQIPISSTGNSPRRSCCASKPSQRKSTIDPDSSRLVRCTDAWLEDKDPQQRQVWADKRRRDDKQRKIEQQQNLKLQKSMKIKRQLYQQFKEWQQQNRGIPFDHETGRVYGHQKNAKENLSKLKTKNIVFLDYQCTEKGQETVSRLPPSSQIRSFRKITSFTRPKRKRIVIEESLNDETYNNHGQRQKSSIPYLETQEGIVLREQSGKTSEKVQAKDDGQRVQSLSLTQRTFKSFSREMMASNRYGRTICTATSVGRTRLLVPQDSKQTGKTSLSSRRDSILWNNHKSLKNHRIQKNPQLLGNYFDFEGEQVQ